MSETSTTSSSPAGGSAPEETTPAAPEASAATDEQLAARLVQRARSEGLDLTGPGGLLNRVTKHALEAALEGEMDGHLGYPKNDPAGRDGANSRNGARSKTVTTDVGPVEVEMPRDRDSSFEPTIVAKRQRRLSGVDDMVLSLVGKGMTTGEVQAHLSEIYGAQVSRETISNITDRVVETMAEWQNRPLDPVYPVIFIDAIHVKIRDGQVGAAPSTSPSGSPWTGNATCWGCGPGPAVRGPSTGCRC